MSAVLLLGFLLGMRHAMEADHVAAVATLATRSHSRRHAIMQGAMWGLGHTLSLFLACSAVLFLDTVIPERLAQALELAVGLMLIALGLDVIRRLMRRRIHFHAHHHGGGPVHCHAHSHAEDVPTLNHDNDVAHQHARDTEHNHSHPQSFPTRALFIGLMHGLAGSAALILLTVTTIASPSTGLIYVALFGLGSIGGMALLSVAISIPLRCARNMTQLFNSLHVSIGLATVIMGVLLVYQNGA
ncbi:urease accessory protein [Marinobacter caseinilyticus]|uniref:HoxN/HupN/NixA family nickel/cobalt transporter n=1 Tax=Marinobacter caseinilyticus TaxID=2692195 RepID=UPI0014097F8D|nr:urease accessory protein [Marinobacter caseinilyticus]